QVLASETGVPDVVDPLGGSYFVEALTDRLESEARALLDQVEAMGGSARAIERGFFQDAIARSAYAFQRAVEAGEQVVVGVNRFEDDGTPPSIPAPDYSALAAGQRERLQRARSRRNAAGGGGREGRRDEPDAGDHRRGARALHRRRDQRRAPWGMGCVCSRGEVGADNDRTAPPDFSSEWGGGHLRSRRVSPYRRLPSRVATGLRHQAQTLDQTREREPRRRDRTGGTLPERSTAGPPPGGGEVNLRRAFETARWAVRAYPGSTALLAGASAVTVGVTLPTLALGAGRLALPPATDPGLPFGFSTFAGTPATIQAQGIDAIAGLLVALGIAALAVGIVTAGSLAVGRAAGRRSEISVRRAVGAARSSLRLSGFVEGVLLALGAIGVGLVPAVAAAR